MKYLLTSAALLAALAAATYHYLYGSSSPEESKSGLKVDGVLVSNSLAADASDGEPVQRAIDGTKHFDTILFESSDFVRSASRTGPPFRLILKTTAVNPVTGRTERWSRTESLSFKPMGVSGITANEFVVFGYGRGDVPTFEYWTLGSDPGTYHSHRSLPGTLVGTPVPLGSTVVSVTGAYTSPSKRDRILPVVDRAEIYRGKGVERISGFAVDPEGRFILAASSVNGALYRVYITEVRDPEIVTTAVTHPVLDETVEILAILHNSNGLGWRILGSKNASYFWDTDSDGVFDSSESMPLVDSYDNYPFGSFELL